MPEDIELTHYNENQEPEVRQDNSVFLTAIALCLFLSFFAVALECTK